jgi:hypothetical protein
VDYPPDLLDELARVFARVALDELLEELAAEARRQEGAGSVLSSESTSATHVVVDQEVPG